MGVVENADAACKETEAKGANLTLGELVTKGLPCAVLSGAHDSYRNIRSDLSDAREYTAQVLAGHISKKDAVLAATGLAVVAGMAVTGRGGSPNAGTLIVEKMFGGDQAAFESSLLRSTLSSMCKTVGFEDSALLNLSPADLLRIIVRVDVRTAEMEKRAIEIGRPFQGAAAGRFTAIKNLRAILEEAVSAR